MQQIKNLFDSSKDIYRTIEKVITYNASQEQRLQTEISEYVVTESIEDQLESLLTKMQAAMDMGSAAEIGVWVSGFYGSGKSSFTKYLGMALDEHIQINGTPFLQYFIDRLHKPQTKALLATVAKRFPASVVFLDLASDMLAGATMEEVSTVLYFKVLQWAGYSQNLKVASFERKLKKDGRYTEFKNLILEKVGVEWSTIQNDPLVVDSLVPELAHRMYPELFSTPNSFSTETRDIFKFEKERVKEMLDIVREHTQKQYTIFIIDEVGQYVGSRQNLILNLDGLAKNLKDIGDGKVWIIGTAQQTLTEDDPRAALNSSELYKLQARFPIQIDLESSDIKEICYRRLLSKSLEGETRLGSVFEQYGQSLRNHTRLEDAKYYDYDFDKENFINLYPFLPAHFDILIHLLGALAKSTGGVGLRSAIKVIQDILIEGGDGRSPVAEEQIGWLATTVTLYDSLEKDIRRAFPSIHQAVEKTLIRFANSPIHQGIAKTVAVLQILDNMPVSINNVTSLMHPSVTSPSLKDEVEQAVEQLITDAIAPFGEQDGTLRFFSEKLNDIEQERATLVLRAVETRRIFNDTLRLSFNPLPSTRLHGSFVVTSGIKVQSPAFSASLAGEQHIIQTVIEFSEPADYDTRRSELLGDSRNKSAQNRVFLLGRNIKDMTEKVSDIFRCREIAQRYRNEPDQEIKDYCAAQNERAERLVDELQNIIHRSLASGSFIFRGQVSAVSTLDSNLTEACKKYLGQVAERVFERYGEAPVRVDTATAEQFLRAGTLASITSKIDPLGLVQINNGKPSIKSDHKALISIRDYLDRNGTVDGKRLTDDFTRDPFGWSADTVRYLIAALLVAGEVKLKVSGRDVTVNGQMAIDALKTNNLFKGVGVALRDERPSIDVLARAADRLTTIVGDANIVVPLEDEISKTAAKHFPRLQSRFAPFEGKLMSLGLPGTERLQMLMQEVADILFTDASDIPQRLGGEQSSLFDTIKWAEEVARFLDNGMDATIEALQWHRKELGILPNSGIFEHLRNDLKDDLDKLSEWLVKDDFYKHAADLNTVLTTIKSRVSSTAIELLRDHKETLRAAEKEFRQLADWNELTQQEQSNVLSQMDAWEVDVTPDLYGIKQIINQQFAFNSTIFDIKSWIVKEGSNRRKRRFEEEKEQAIKEGRTKLTKTIKIPSFVSTAEQVDQLITQLQELRQELSHYGTLEIIIDVKE